MVVEILAHEFRINGKLRETDLKISEDTAAMMPKEVLKIVSGTLDALN